MVSDQTHMTQHSIPNTQYPARNARHMELPVIVAVLLIAAAFRLAALDVVPPGLHHDEVIIGQVAKDILRGRLAIYFPEGYGHEPLYHYILAGMFAIGGANEFTLRLTTALLGILTVAVVYRMARVMFGRSVALMSTAWLAVSLWPVFYSRIGLRNITLPLMISLTVWLLWSSLKFQIPDLKSQTPALPTGGLPLSSAKRWGAAGRWHRTGASVLNRKFIWAGIAFGLTFYTYQGSRVFPLVFLIWAVYLAIFHRATFVKNRKGIVLFFIVAALVAAPLAYYLIVVNPQAEARIANLSGPIKALLAGDPSQVLQLAIATAGMFTARGDGVWLYNVSGRPVFPEPMSGALFYIGLLVALWRWRKPKYALLLIWLPVCLIPAAVTWPAPDFVRALGALPVTFVFPAIAIKTVVDILKGPETIQGLPARAGHSEAIRSAANPPTKAGAPFIALALVGLLAWNIVLTARDYFGVWPRNEQVRWLYQATWAQAARWLDVEGGSTPVAVSGLKIHDLDPQTFDLLRRRRDVEVKWFDCRTSILLPTSGAMRYITPDFFPCDADLWSRFLGDVQNIKQPRWPDTNAVIFTATLRLERTDPSGLGDPKGPSLFGPLSLLKSEITRPTVARGREAELLTFWRVTDRVPSPTAIFVHVVGNDGKPVAQWDGFDFGEVQLEPGDQLIERHRFIIPPDVAPAAYRVIAGVYNPATNKRLTLPSGDDYVVLGNITVQ